MIHTMSITKAAIGMVYHVSPPKTKTIFGIPFVDALNMMSGYDDDAWDYDDFRKQVDDNANLAKYAEKRLKTASRVKKWCYNNLVYQLLASKLPVAKLFADFMGDTLVQKGRYMTGDGWMWEHTKDGEALGPHGLWMTEKCAIKFGERSRPHLKMKSFVRVQFDPREWKGVGSGILQHYGSGWFFAKNAYAIGYRAQVVAVTPTGVKTQLYEEDWDKELTQEQKKFIHTMELLKF